MIRFALKTLFFDRGKLLIALVGVIFSVVLVSVQGGLFLGLMSKASMLVDNSQADIWVCRRGVENVDFAHLLPEAWLTRARGTPGVLHAEPLVVGKSMATLRAGGYEDVWVIGEAPRSQIPFKWPYTAGARESTWTSEAISIDQYDTWKLGDARLGDVLELGGRRARVAAHTRGVLGFLVTPYLTTSIDSARQYCGVPDHLCSYLLVRAAPNASVTDVCQQLRRRLPEADVLPAATFGAQSRRYWMSRTGIGLSFGASTALGLFVGLVMVAQSLYALTLDRLSDYATLKAMGADISEIHRVLMAQALAIALIGCVIGGLLSQTLVANAATPITPIVVPFWLTLVGIVVNIAICLASASLPARRIRRVDPLTVLQS